MSEHTHKASLSNGNGWNCGNFHGSFISLVKYLSLETIGLVVGSEEEWCVGHLETSPRLFVGLRKLGLRYKHADIHTAGRRSDLGPLLPAELCKHILGIHPRHTPSGFPLLPDTEH